MKRKGVYKEEREAVNFPGISAVKNHQGIHTNLHILTNQTSLILLSISKSLILCLILSGLSLKVEWPNKALY